MIARCSTCGTTMSRASVQELSDLLWAHDNEKHRGVPPAPTELPTVTWHRQALDAIHSLAKTGRPFVISQVIEYGVPDAPNPRTDWAKVQREAVDFGWIEPTGRLGKSVRPSTKSSPVTEWVGTFAARRSA